MLGGGRGRTAPDPLRNHEGPAPERSGSGLFACMTPPGGPRRHGLGRIGGEGLLRLREGAWEAVAVPERIRGAEIHDLAEAGEGWIWLATDRGVARVPSAAEGRPVGLEGAEPG